MSTVLKTAGLAVSYKKQELPQAFCKKLDQKLLFLALLGLNGDFLLFVPLPFRQLQ